MTDKILGNNQVNVYGEVVSTFSYSHEVYGEGFYMLQLSVKRLSKVYDIIPLMISEQEEMRSLTKISPKRKLTLLPKMQKRCVLSIKNIPAESGFIISTRTEKRRLTDCQEQQIRLLFIRQMRLLL